MEFDELEKLLCEIPNATSGLQHSEESRPKRDSLNDNLSPIFVDYKESLTKKLQNNGNLENIQLLVNKTQQSPVKRVEMERPNLPDDNSLTSAFANLNFNDGITMETVSSPLANCGLLSTHAGLLEGQYPSSLKNPAMASQMMFVPSFNSPANMFSHFDKFGAAKFGQEGANPLKLDAQGLRRLQVGYCQQVQDLSAGIPQANGLQGFQFLSNTVIPNMDFALMSDQQQYFTDAPSPYFHAQQLSQPQPPLRWRNIEEEQYYRMNQQFLYLQQLRNQQLEAQHPVHVDANFPNRLMNRSMRQQYFEIPIPRQVEQSTGPFWSDNAITRGLNQSNPSFSCADHEAAHVLAKVGKHNFPDKVLKRSHGRNTLKAVKFGSVGGNESRTHVNQNRKVLSDSHCNHRFSLNAECFCLDNLSSWGLSADAVNLKSKNLRPQPQKYSSLDELNGRIYFMAKDQHGCRFLQQIFLEGTPEDIEKIFLEVIDNIVDLMTDPFGNYLVQKLLEVCDEGQIMRILHAITRKSGDLVKISCNMHGTRAVQKVIETLKTPEQFSMVVSSLKPGIVSLVKDMNGNHVAQRCLQYLMPEYSKFLFEAATANCVELATDRHGCCVLQKCLTYAEGEQRRRLVCEITSNALILSQDPFGNYVVQFVFELELPWATVDTLDQLEGNYGDLSMQKYSSNVVERCLKYAGEERCARIIKELMSNSRLDQIMQDPYGNYVIQAALNHSKGSAHAALVDAIRPHVPILRTSPYGKKVLSSNSLKK